MFSIHEINQLYIHFKASIDANKYFPHHKLLSYLHNSKLENQQIGESFLGKSIHKITVGNGAKHILIWSQMHGNESTGTKAMFDVISFLQRNHPESKKICNNLTLHYIPMLNPDGADLYTRTTATGIDMNRDFLAKSCRELQLLINLVKENEYEFLFNLHDQRTIFNVGESRIPATLSFLAPSGNYNQTLTEVRKDTMGVIAKINKDLQLLIPGKIGKYNHAFYPRATGDNFTRLNQRCLLFEAGHFPKDYQREQTRKYNALAIISALQRVAQTSDYQLNYLDYEQIPQNHELYLDVIFRNVKIESNHSQIVTDLGIYFEDELDGNTQKLHRKAMIKEIGDLSSLFGHHEIDAEKKLYKDDSKNLPKINDLANFKIQNKIYNSEFFKHF